MKMLQTLVNVFLILGLCSTGSAKTVAEATSTCTSLESMKENYLHCCANGGYKLENRKAMCSLAGAHAKRK